MTLRDCTKVLLTTWVLLATVAHGRAAAQGRSGARGAAQGGAAAEQALTFEQAKTAMDAAEAEARRNGWRLTIVVADSAGVPLYLRRLPGASGLRTSTSRPSPGAPATRRTTTACGACLRAFVSPSCTTR